MLLSGSIFILGFFTITRGKVLVLPNENEEEEKEIFGAWQLFWEQVVRYDKIFYSGKQLEFKLKILEQFRPMLRDHISLTEEKKSLIFDYQPTKAEVRDIEFNLNCKGWQKDDILFLYDEYPVYKFSEWVRKITNCYVCLSSLGGSFYYWLLMYKYPEMLPSTIWKLVFWVIYCVSLSFINKVIKENFDNEKK